MKKFPLLPVRVLGKIPELGDAQGRSVVLAGTSGSGLEPLMTGSGRDQARRRWLQKVCEMSKEVFRKLSGALCFPLCRKMAKGFVVVGFYSFVVVVNFEGETEREKKAVNVIYLWLSMWST